MGQVTKATSPELLLSMQEALLVGEPHSSTYLLLLSPLGGAL